jgi:prepilin-type N-terminal cleavage/methylation domain-containing protein
MIIHLGQLICKNKMMRKHLGFSLLEVMVVMAIIFIIASIAMPPFLRWRTDAQLRGAASNLRGDLELAKLRAIRENSFVAVLFNANDYIIFVDNGTSAGDWVEDEDETQIRNGQLPEGVYIVMPTALADDRTRFFRRRLQYVHVPQQIIHDAKRCIRRTTAGACRDRLYDSGYPHSGS